MLLAVAYEAGLWALEFVGGDARCDTMEGCAHDVVQVVVTVGQRQGFYIAWFELHVSDDLMAAQEGSIWYLRFCS